ncbi:hypothetical protein QBC32DRAFT_386855 [Pseudoneurospora amorphoporcata]|uniref:Uncharacterized protein n=1 Tax=Pseudoneurospora amorphoporcata TaxID=241081 RepID=A0AAN6SHS3_9PEZI|nr:hypothetical protein QBC32DRAFT_386855 [Pseudoneurospora amorphoporcata]
MEAQEPVAEAAEVLKLVPIPQLLEDFSNYDEWEHALFFHLSYYNLADFVADHITPPREINEANHSVQRGPEYVSLRRHHAYAIIFNSVRDLMPKLTEDSKLPMPYVSGGYNARDYDPAALYRHIMSYKYR